VKLALAAACLALAATGSPAGAADGPVPEGGRISVLGQASLEVPPDHAAVTVAVVTRAPGPGAALDANSAAAARIVEAARAAGAKTDEVGTGAVTLAPAFRNVRDGSGNYGQQPDGYEASNSVRVRLADIGKLGEFMRRAVESGANRIESVSFGLADPARAEREASAAAARDATARAQAIAAAAGTNLGPILRIVSPARSDGPDLTRVAMRAVAPAPAGRAVPLQAGTVTVGAAVEIEWSLRP
jgi:uncharacterized protein